MSSIRWRCTALVGLAAMLAGCASVSTSVTQTEAAPAASVGVVQSSDDPWELVGRPGEAHDLLASLAGEWEVTARVWVSPDEPPREGRGTLRREMVLGGHYLREELNAETVLGPMSGVGYIGFNNFDGRFEYVWMDDRSTVISFETGRYNQQTQTLVGHGTLRDPVTGELLDTRTEMDLSNPDRHRSTGYTTGPDGVPFKTFEGTLVRR